MEIIETAIPDVVIIRPKLFGDSRGYFFESYSQRDFDRLVRPVHFVQDNESRSCYGVVSPTFGRHVAVELSGENHLQLFIPRGFAHGFSVLSDEVVFQYKCDNFYAPASEGAVAWDDPDLGIDWGIRPQDAVLSAKDAAHPRLRDIAPEDLFSYGESLYPDE